MILQALKGYYDREIVRERPAVPPLGYSFEQIDAVLVLSRTGDPIALQRIPEGRYAVPQVERTSGIKPKFLWDNTSYVFGASERSKRTEREHASFREQHIKALGDSDDEGLRALYVFLSRWQPSSFASLPGAKDALDANLVFKLDGEAQYLHQRPSSREIWLDRYRSTWGTAALCSVTGIISPIAPLHPAIGGVRGAQTSGAYIVSFNADAYESYGLSGGGNAPVSEAVAFEYTAALSSLLAKGSRNKVQIGDATTVFWAEAANAAQADQAEVTFAAFLNPPDDAASEDDAGATAKVRDVVKAMADGRPLEQAAPDLAPDTRFYVLGLSPNAARISVRFFHATTLGDLGAAFQQHWQDLRIEPVPWKTAPAIWRLMSRMAPARRNQQGVVKYDTKSIPPNLAGELMRSILTGGSYPRTIATSVLIRFRTDHEIDGLRVSLIKACLVRDMRRTNPALSGETYVSLNRDDPNPAYRLGRLFAILEKTQRAAMDGVNSTICDRYYGAASATPQRVFAFLVKNSKNHLATLRKGRGAKWVKKPAATGGWLDRQIGEIYATFEGTIPASLTLEAQSRFAIGYYHEKYARRDDAPDDLRSIEPDLADDATDSSDTAE